MLLIYLYIYFVFTFSDKQQDIEFETERIRRDLEVTKNIAEERTLDINKLQVKQAHLKLLLMRDIISTELNLQIKSLNYSLQLT